MLRTAGSSSYPEKTGQCAIHVPTRSAGSIEQRLADAIPTEDAAAAAMKSKLRIFVGKHLRLRSPEPVCGLQPVHGIGRAKFAGLHDEGEQSRRQAQQK